MRYTDRQPVKTEKGTHAMKKYHFNALNIEPALFFRGTPEEIDRAENAEEAAAEALKAIIYAPGFKALEIRKQYPRGTAREILHHSTRPGVLFQLSYIDPDGVPAMHENFIQTAPDAVPEAIHEERDLLAHFVGLFRHERPLDIFVL